MEDVEARAVTPERLAHQRVGASAYFSKLHRKLAQIFSAVLYCCVNVAGLIGSQSCFSTVVVPDTVWPLKTA